MVTASIGKSVAPNTFVNLRRTVFPGIDTWNVLRTVESTKTESDWVWKGVRNVPPLLSGHVHMEQEED